MGWIAFGLLSAFVCYDAFSSGHTAFGWFFSVTAVYFLIVSVAEK